MGILIPPTENEDRLEKELSKIEEKYAEYFKSKKSKNEGEEHDRLSNHYIYTYNIHPKEAKFGFEPNSDLPANIKDECIKVFNFIYHNK